jgi:Chaperone of endosialidase
MKQVPVGMVVVVLLLCLSFFSQAQQTVVTNADVVVPPLVNFSGVLTDVNGKPLTGVVGVTFYLYKEEQGGAPLWMETQNVTPNKAGRYTVMLGSTSSQGLPADLFASGEARWLAVQAQGQPEQPRVMLLSVPYALKAVDAQTIGGLPPSAFVLAAPPSTNAATTSDSSAASLTPATTSDVTTTGGKANTIPMFTTATNIQNSILTQTGTIAINVVGKLNLPALGTATASAGFKSNPQDFVASTYNSSSKAAVAETFQLQAEPASNDTTAPSGTLNLLYASGTATPAETGLKISNKGLITFASGQTFPTVTGNETVTGELTASQLISTVATGTAPLKVTSTTEVANLNASLLGGKATSAFAQLAAANTFTGNQTVDGNLSATGTVAGSSFEIGSNLFAFGSFANNNAFLGFAGNTTMTGTGNTATGFQALYSNINGTVNTAVGDRALYYNTLGNDNIAVGGSALGSNTTGSSNTAIGQGALLSNSIDSGNTAVGFDALENNYSINNTALGNTAVGFEALQESTTCCSTAVGSGALQSNTTNPNDAFGYGALNNNTTGDYNAAVGELALNQNTEGNSNIALGQRALYSNTTGNENTAVGVFALSSNTTGSDLTCIGYACTPSSDALTNATAIGAHAVVGQSNSLVLGGTGDHAVKVGIGTTTPSNILTVGRGSGHPVSDSWETYSSRRWKTNIHPLQNALSKVEQLRGVSYDLKDSGRHEIGVIAEEVGNVVPEVVSYEKNGKDATGVDYSRLTALLIEAVKQQQKQITAQQSLIRKQQWVTRAQQIEISTQRKLINTQQDEISGLSRKVGVLESSLPTGQPDKLAVLTLK